MTREQAKETVKDIKEPFTRGYVTAIIDGIYDDFDLIMQEYQSRINALQLKYIETKKWGYSMRDSAHKFDKEIQELKSRTCAGCKYDEKDDAYPTICWECSRYYDDNFEKG